MTPKEFESLDQTGKANAVWDGKFISSNVMDDIFVQFYDLGGLLIDVYYDPMSNQITDFLPSKL